jgi:hypothetical protein
MSACNETNLMHYLSSAYPVTIPLHVLDLLVAQMSRGNILYMQQMVHVCFS